MHQVNRHRAYFAEFFFYYESHCQLALVLQPYFLSAQANSQTVNQPIKNGNLAVFEKFASFVELIQIIQIEYWEEILRIQLEA